MPGKTNYSLTGNQADGRLAESPPPDLAVVTSQAQSGEAGRPPQKVLSKGKERAPQLSLKSGELGESGKSRAPKNAEALHF
jgi:hypothetical protein